MSKRSLYSDLFAHNSHSTEHIALKDWGELLVVAPATGNIIGKMANGIADDALSTLLMSFSQKPVYLCPSMNSDMLHSPAVQHNLHTLKQRGVTIIESKTGELACGTTGDGRMAEPEEIFNNIISQQRQPLKGRRYLITAGPTYEKIDSVRFIGNYSSGKMGYAIADEIARQGGEAILISGSTHLIPREIGVKCLRVESAREMYEEATKIFAECDGAILSAAVADYRPASCADHKLKKQGDAGMTLELVQNPDILATLGQQKHEGQQLIGFALETDNEQANAQKKLEKKNLDYIVLNSLRDKGAGFGVDTNKVTIIGRDGSERKGELKSKADVAKDIVQILVDNIQKQ